MIEPLAAERATYGADDSRFITKKRSNLKSDLIEITEDKLENILLKHESKLGRKRAWIAPLGLLLTVVATLLSADFKKEALGLSASVWSALFLLVAAGACVWLVVTIVSLAAGWKDCSVDALIAHIKNSNDEVQ